MEHNELGHFVEIASLHKSYRQAITLQARTLFAMAYLDVLVSVLATFAATVGLLRPELRVELWLGALATVALWALLLREETAYNVRRHYERKETEREDA